MLSDFDIDFHVKLTFLQNVMTVGLTTFVLKSSTLLHDMISNISCIKY